MIHAQRCARMNIDSKISFLDRKLRHDRRAIVVSLVWMIGVIAIASCGGFVLHALLPSFDGRELVAWVAPGVFGISLPAPIKEYMVSRQSILALTWLREQYASSRDPGVLAELDARFTHIFDKVATA